MNRYPAWKYLLIIAVVVFGGIYALPNLYGEEPAIQISSDRDIKIDTRTLDRVERVLKTKGISYRAIALEPQGLVVRFADTETQLQAKDIVKDALGRGYIVALNLAPLTPDWLVELNALPMYLGLDLRGGVHFLMEVDVDAAIDHANERYVSDFRTKLREGKLRYLLIDKVSDELGNAVTVKFKDEASRDQAIDLLEKEYDELEFKGRERDGTFFVRASLTENEQREIKNLALQQNITTLRNRVNELGVAEPVIQRQGENRIVVQLPGVQDTARAKDILGATATLEFRMVEGGRDADHAARSGISPPGTKLFYERNGNPVLLKSRVMLTGDYIVDASSGIESQTGSPAVFITLDGKGASIFSKATRDQIGKPMAVVFIENKVETRYVNGEPTKFKQRIEEVINIATIRDQLGKRFQISGLDDTTEARDLALLLRAGALAAPIEIVEERTVGPSLGQDNIDQGFQSVIIGFIMVLAFMVMWYRGFGMVANVALALNLVLIVAVLSTLQATLTLPGIAGIVLTVGMAVDANVLIFERIREELRAGNSPQGAISAGYDKAVSTIADANITTLIAAVVLFGFGTGPIKGFAITLSIGILTSMFTAIVVTRGVVNLSYGRRQRLSKLSL